MLSGRSALRRDDGAGKGNALAALGPTSKARIGAARRIRTIAHGFLSLSLLPLLMEDLMVVPQGTKMAVNYGLDSLRFIQPVRVGSRVRLHATLLDAHEKNPGQWLLKTRAEMQIEGAEKPAYIAQSLALCFV